MVARTKRPDHDNPTSAIPSRMASNKSDAEAEGATPVQTTVPKFAKLDSPRYKDLEDPLGWLKRCKHFFRHQHTAKAEKVGLASYHLEVNAQLWFLQLEADYPNLTWVDFKQHCHLCFGPPIWSNKLGELSKLRHTGSMTTYQEHFKQLASCARQLTRAQKIELYISGLQEYILVEVEIHYPTNLATAMSLSRLYECKTFSGSSLRLSETRKFKAPDRSSPSLSSWFIR